MDAHHPTLAQRSIAVSVAALTRERARRGWTAAELAKRAGVSAQTISNLSRDGRCAPSTLRQIAGAFDAAPPVPGVDALLAGADSA